MKFDLGLAFNEGVAKVRDNFQLLAIIAGVFLFVPSALLAIAVPDLMTAAMEQMTLNPENPDAMLSLFTPGVIAGYIAITLLSFVGYTAMIALMNHDHNLTVGEAITRGFKSLPTLIGVLLLFLVGYFLFAIAIGVVLGLVIAALSAISSTLTSVMGAVMFIVLIPLILLVLTRLSMIMPVVAIDGVTNPVTVITRSWSLTKASQWRLLGFFALLFVAYFVISLLIFGLLGVIISAAGGITVLAILSSLIGMVVAMFFSGIIAAVHGQLRDATDGSVADTFD